MTDQLFINANNKAITHMTIEAETGKVNILPFKQYTKARYLKAKRC